MVRHLTEVIDGHHRDDLPVSLHQGFSCCYVHADESFDRDAWVRLNAGHPGFQRFTVEDRVGDGDRAAARSHVTAVRDGLVAEMTEVWTDVRQGAPQGTRPG